MQSAETCMEFLKEEWHFRRRVSFTAESYIIIVVVYFVTTLVHGVLKCDCSLHGAINALKFCYVIMSILLLHNVQVT